MKYFEAFADHPFGSWVIMVLAVVAGILGLKLITSKFPDSGPLGAFKAGISAV